MRTVAILPVKSFGRAKQRLGDAVPNRPALAAAMLADVLDALARVPELDELIVVTAERRRGRRRPRGRRAAWSTTPPRPASRPPRRLGIDAARADRALLVPGDCPALDPGEVTALLEETAPVVIVPDRHGHGHERAAADAAGRDGAGVR